MHHGTNACFATQNPYAQRKEATTFVYVCITFDLSFSLVAEHSARSTDQESISSYIETETAIKQQLHFHPPPS